jgi:hypothetical protein
VQLGKDTAEPFGALSGLSLVLQALGCHAAEHDAARFGGPQCSLGPFADHAPFLLGQGRVDVDMKGSVSTPSSVTMNGTPYFMSPLMK